MFGAKIRETLQASVYMNHLLIPQLLNHTVPGQASQRQFTSIKCPILLLVADNLLCLNQWKREIIFPRKNVPDAWIDHCTAACEADMLPTELQKL